MGLARPLISPTPRFLALLAAHPDHPLKLGQFHGQEGKTDSMGNGDLGKAIKDSKFGKMQSAHCAIGSECARRELESGPVCNVSAVAFNGLSHQEGGGESLMLYNHSVLG